jgi:hypothetical protein
MVTMVPFFSRESDKPPRCSFLSARGGIQNPKCEPWMNRPSTSRSPSGFWVLRSFKVDCFLIGSAGEILWEFAPEDSEDLMLSVN